MGLSQEGSVVVVVDRYNHRLVLWRLGDGTVWKQLGSQGTEPGQSTRRSRFEGPGQGVGMST